MFKREGEYVNSLINQGKKIHIPTRLTRAEIKRDALKKKMHKTLCVHICLYVCLHKFLILLILVLILLLILILKYYHSGVPTLMNAVKCPLLCARKEVTLLVSYDIH